MQLTSHNHSTKNLNLQEQNGTLFCNTLAQPLLMFAPRALHDVSIVLTIHFLTLCNMSTSNTVQYKGMYDISPHKSLVQKWPFLAITCCYQSDSILLLRLCPPPNTRSCTWMVLVAAAITCAVSHIITH